MNGIEHIAATFERTRAQGRAALMPYFTLGFPDPQASLDILEAVACSGADILELGVPFSDPLADGPTIQHSTQIALERGITVRRCLEMVAELRSRGVAQPLFLMSYTNPILAYGVRRFAADARAAGADGCILPDQPPEEAGEIEATCREVGLALVYLLAPTSTTQRIAYVSARTTGFLYLVSLTGVTGAREGLSQDLGAFVERVRKHAITPLAVGFGISTPEQARAVGRMADGVIVGSALIQATMQAEEPVKAAGEFVRGLRQAL